MKTLAALSALLLGLSAQAQQTPAQKEWHNYCEMTEHVTVTGWELEEKKWNDSVKIKNITCSATFSNDFGSPVTVAEAVLTLENVAWTKLPPQKAYYTAYYDKEISAKEACAPILKLSADAIANGGFANVEIRTKLVRQDWTSVKNIDVILIESIGLTFENNIYFNSGNTLRARGEYCSKKP